MRRGGGGRQRESVWGFSGAGLFGRGQRVHRKGRDLQAVHRADQGVGVLRGQAVGRAPRADQHVRAGDAGAVHLEQVSPRVVDAARGAAQVSGVLRDVRLG